MDIVGLPTITEVEYFFRLWFGDTVHSLALVFVFSPSDQEILELSNHATFMCHHGRTDALTVIDISKRVQPLEGIIWVQDVYKHFSKNQRPFN